MNFYKHQHQEKMDCIRRRLADVASSHPEHDEQLKQLRVMVEKLNAINVPTTSDQLDEFLNDYFSAMTAVNHTDNMICIEKMNHVLARSLQR